MNQPNDECEAVIEPLFRSGEVSLPDLIMRVPLEPLTIANAIRKLVRDDILAIGKPGSGRRLADRFLEFVRANSAPANDHGDGLTDRRKRLHKSVLGDSELGSAVVRFSRKGLRGIAAA